MHSSAKLPWREAFTARFLLGAPQGIPQGMAIRVVKQAGIMKDLAHALHPLSAAADDAPLATLGSTHSAFWFSRFVDERSFKASGTRRDDTRRVAYRLYNRPTTGRNSKVNTKHEHSKSPTLKMNGSPH